MPKNRDYTGLLRTPPSLTWLIRERSRLQGQIENFRALINRLNREAFSFTFALQVLAALGASPITIPQPAPELRSTFTRFYEKAKLAVAS